MDHTASHLVLQAALVDLIDLSLVAKQTHWNVTGPNFRSVHLELDEVVEIARTASDDVAERLRAIGGVSDGRASTLAKDSHIADVGAGLLEDGKVTAIMAECLEQVADRIEGDLPKLDDDLPSQDLLIGIVTELNKAKWMFAQQVR